ncbi:IS5 family transposase [Neisseria sp. HSC-16F19]|nr:IS5 family transposase [Neisseria sp. HSC-16F19]MCP2041975.1 IS5 family transposase [Neisseria sp. HSC-16F19]
MSSFFIQDAEAIIYKHIDSYPLLKIQDLLDWVSIENLLSAKKTRYIRDNGGRPAYPLLPMFKAVLLGQWHSLSDPELERCLSTRLDFILFCRFDGLNMPDHSTLCRFRNWLAQDNTLAMLLDEINRQLADKQLKVEKAEAAVIDATIIQTAGGKQRKAIEVDEAGNISAETTPSKDKDARWIKKGGKFHLGYKQHTRTDQDGYIEKIHITPANAHEVQHFEPLLDGIHEGAMVYADKGYASQDNREHLSSRKLKDGIMEKAYRGRPLSEMQKIRNACLAKIRYVVEQTFGTQHRRFCYSRASYFGLQKVAAQSHLKAICLNLLKAGNRIRVSVAA